MKKVIAILSIAALAACGGASTEVKVDSLAKDTLTPSTLVADSAIIDSLKNK